MMRADTYLKASAKTKITTSFIFCLAEFEKYFGTLWGEFKEDGEKLTEDEEKFDWLYEKLRKHILDNGNMQIRKFEEELGFFDIKWKEDNKEKEATNGKEG